MSTGTTCSLLDATTELQATGKYVVVVPGSTVLKVLFLYFLLYDLIINIFYDL